MTSLQWFDDASFELEGVTFHTRIDERSTSTKDHFHLVKPRQLLERYEELISDVRPQRIMELGIFQGGSAALLHLLAKPELLVALDIRRDPATGLEEFIDERGLRDRLRTHHGFDQSDVVRLRRLVASEFGNGPLDLVVDDASHRLAQTRASFNALFPHLRPGGVFVIEDWSGLHQVEVALTTMISTDPTARARLDRKLRSGQTAATPLSVLLFELVLAAAYAPRLFAEIVIADGWAHVVRGSETIDPDAFDVSQVYSERAGRLLATTQ
jgi:predicted O-methyltransferase YrrM